MLTGYIVDSGARKKSHKLFDLAKCRVDEISKMTTGYLRSSHRICEDLLRIRMDGRRPGGGDVIHSCYVRSATGMPQQSSSRRRHLNCLMTSLECDEPLRRLSLYREHPQLCEAHQSELKTQLRPIRSENSAALYKQSITSVCIEFELANHSSIRTGMTSKYIRRSGPIT